MEVINIKSRGLRLKGSSFDLLLIFCLSEFNLIFCCCSSKLSYNLWKWVTSATASSNILLRHFGVIDGLHILENCNCYHGYHGFHSWPILEWSEFESSLQMK